MFANKKLVLTEEEKDSLTKILNTKYAGFLNKRLFQVEAFVEGDTAAVAVILQNPNNRFFYPVEARMLFREQNMNAKDAALFLIDYLDYYFEEYFRDDEDVYLTIDWSKHSFEGKDFYVKGQVLNPEQEKLADEWLKANLK